MTAFGTIDSAVEAIKKGAEDSLQNPSTRCLVPPVVERAMEKARLLAETTLLPASACASATRSVTSSASTPRCAR